MSDRPPVTGPFRVYVRDAAVGVGLDVSHMVVLLLLQLAQDFEEDPEGVAHELLEIAAWDRSARGDDSHAGHERDERLDALLESIGGAVLPVYGRQVLELAERLRVLGMRKMPRQRSGGGEAA